MVSRGVVVIRVSLRNRSRGLLRVGIVLRSVRKIVIASMGWRSIINLKDVIIGRGLIRLILRLCSVRLMGRKCVDFFLGTRLYEMSFILPILP